MRDVDVLANAIEQIEMILAEHIEPGHRQDPVATINRIFRTLDKNDVAAAVERVRAGYGELHIIEGVAGP